MITTEEKIASLGYTFRAKLYRMILENPGQSNVDLANKVDQPMNVWPHLRKLVEAGLIRKVEQGPRDVVYYPEEDVAKELSAWFTPTAA